MYVCVCVRRPTVMFADCESDVLTKTDGEISIIRPMHFFLCNRAVSDLLGGVASSMLLWHLRFSTVNIET
jgi:hypothetical protein